MTSEAIKALMILALYGALEIALYFSSFERFAKRPVRSERRQTPSREFAVQSPPED
ncbi:hypothetical protein [Bradyrhizobium sp. CCGUVB23]|uniref:hypothetical protein n=1 Tax=Bradyrhizobium sp. CCGUVB23 TaxID=2949630 RepID=UPI0020B27EB1|nr:hypothetical protein [Bradyrhizobium sp. CCGUVB23]MCP3463384.1 hypothetical protein [Bradyrhizobium sp. CCGUVB23]